MKQLISPNMVYLRLTFLHKCAHRRAFPVLCNRSIREKFCSSYKQILFINQLFLVCKIFEFKYFIQYLILKFLVVNWFISVTRKTIYKSKAQYVKAIQYLQNLAITHQSRHTSC